MPFLAPAIAAIGGAIATVSSFLGPVGGFLAKVGISFGLNLAIKALRGDTQQGGTAGGVSVNAEYGANVSRKVACGLVGMAGQPIYDNTYGEANKFWQRVFKLSDYPVDGLSRVGIGGEWVTLAETETGDRGYEVISGEASGFVWIKFYDGTQTAADDGLVDNANPEERWASTAIGTGCAYVIVTSKFDRLNFTAPPQMFFEVRGAKLYDWRLDTTAGGDGAQRLADPDTWAFSENPVVIEYNYRLGFSVNGDLFCGMGMAQGDLPMDAFTTAANICDEDVDGEARFRASIIFDAAQEHGDHIDALAAATGGMVVNSVAGAWPLIGTDQSVVATLTDDDVVDGTRATFQARRSMADLVNLVAGTYAEPANLWSMSDYALQTDSAVVSADRRNRDATMDFPMVRVKRQAEQLAAQYFSENRFEATISGLTVRPRWRVLEVGDWIRFNSARWGDKTYLVVKRRMAALDEDGPRNTVLDLQQRDGDIYTSVGTVTPPVTPTANDAPAYLAEVQSLGITPVTVTADGGLAAAGIRVSWDAITDTTVTGVEIEYRVKASPTAVFTAQIYNSKTVTYLSEGVVQSTQYEVRTTLLTTGRAVSATAWTTVTTVTLPASNVQVGLANLRDDIAGIFTSSRTELDALLERIELLAASTGAAAAEHQVKTIFLAAETANTKALVVEEASVRATADSAMASAISAVEAGVGNVLASGLMRISSSVYDEGASADITFQTRLTTEDDFGEAGMVLQVYTEGESVLSRIVMSADKVVMTDGTDEGLPFEFSGGVLKLAVANIGTVTAGLLKSPDDLMQINLASGLITISEEVA